MILNSRSYDLQSMMLCVVLTSAAGAFDLDAHLLTAHLHAPGLETKQSLQRGGAEQAADTAGTQAEGSPMTNFLARFLPKS